MKPRALILTALMAALCAEVSGTGPASMAAGEHAVRIDERLGMLGPFEPVWLPEPRPSLYPHSASPEAPLRVFDARGATDQRTNLLLVTAQGVINRERPRLVVLWSDTDAFWLDWLRETGRIGPTVALASPREVLETFSIRDVVVYDPRFPATINLATMIGAVRGLAMAHPAVVRRFDLHVAEDLRGRWRTNIEAYEWAFEHIWPEMNHSVIACFNPLPHQPHLRDYLVAQRIFTFWITGENDSDDGHSSPEVERRGIGRMLAQMPVNIPVMGYPHSDFAGGMLEGPGVTFLSHYGKFLVPTGWFSNLSVWTGIPRRSAELRQQPPRRIHLEPEKVYAALLLSDGDNVCCWYYNFRPYWENPNHGQIPMAWTMGPSLLDLCPFVVDYFYERLARADSVGCAVSGLGYIYAEHYGDAFGRRRGEVWRDFLRLTGEHMEQLDQRWIWVMRYGERGGPDLADYATELPGLVAIFADYGAHGDSRGTVHTVDGVPVFHAANGWSDDMLEQITSAPGDRRPGFVHVFLLNWKFDMDAIAALVSHLPDDFVLVRPDELGALHREAVRRGLVSGGE